MDEWIPRHPTSRGHTNRERPQNNDISEGATGVTYEKLFQPFLNDNVRRITVVDPWVVYSGRNDLSRHQIDNFDNFVKLCVNKARNLETIELITNMNKDPVAFARQDEALEVIRDRLAQQRVILDIEYTTKGHDRHI